MGGLYIGGCVYVLCEWMEGGLMGGGGYMCAFGDVI